MGSDGAAEAIQLTIRSGDGRGRNVTLGNGRMVLGRADDCDLTVPDLKASRRHAALDALPDGRVSLVDLDSGNGTYVNGRRVESAVLEGHEQIQIGDTVLVSSRGHAAGVTVIGDSAPPQTPSALHRLMVKRSLRRTTLVVSVAVGVATLLGVLLMTGVLGGGDSTDEAVKRLARAAGPSTVVIDTASRGGGTGTGTGWVLDAGRGLIVTNAHIVSGRGGFQVGVEGELRRASLLGVAPCEDLAVLRVKDSSGLRSLPLGRQSNLALGQTVVALGYPRNASLETNLTSTTGVVSVVRTSYRERVLDHPRFSNVIQTDAAINPGNSGGPLLDLDARLIGVTSAARTLTPEGRVVQGQNYAIGVDRVREVTSVLRTGHSMGSTGAGFDYPTPKELSRRRQPPGLLIAGAAHGSPADRARLGSRGNLLVAINGQPIDNSLASYCDVVQGIRAGRPVTFSVLAPHASRPREVRLALE